MILERLEAAPDIKSAVDPIVETLWFPLETAIFSVSAMRTWSRAQLDAMMTGDTWKDNLILNKYEFATGASRLESFPWRFSVPFVLCNARCEFCSAWLVKGEPMPIDLLDRLDVILPYLAQIDMVGWGEPLIHPEFEKIVDKLKSRADPRARITLTTNGVHLAKWVDRLIEARVRDYGISIHAAKSETHEDLMGLPKGSFGKALEGIRSLCAKRAEVAEMSISLVFIVMQQNLEEIPEFILLAESIAADSIFFRTLKSRTLDEQRGDGLDYHRLPPYLHPRFEELRTRAVAAIASANVRVEASPESWSTGIYPAEIEADILRSPLTPREVRRASKSYHRAPTPDTEDLPIGEHIENSHPETCEELMNPYSRSPPLFCPSPYTALYINGFDRTVTPCCYMQNVPGYQRSFLRKGASFNDVWNSPAMVALRRSLHKGPLKQPCLKCAFYW